MNHKSENTHTPYKIECRSHWAAIILIFGLIYHCIYADVTPPDPATLNATRTVLRLEMNAEPLTPLFIRYRDHSKIINLPLSANHRVDTFGVYLNQLTISENSANYSIWVFLDKNDNSTIDSADQAFAVISQNITNDSENTDLVLSANDLLDLAAVSPTGVLPANEGTCYCFFKPTNAPGEAVNLTQGLLFSDWRPFASWEKTSSESPQNLKEAYLPVGLNNNRFTGTCIFDENLNEQFDQNETTFSIPEFEVLPDRSNLFIVSNP